MEQVQEEKRMLNQQYCEKSSNSMALKPQCLGPSLRSASQQLCDLGQVNAQLLDFHIYRMHIIIKLAIQSCFENQNSLFIPTHVYISLYSSAYKCIWCIDKQMCINIIISIIYNYIFLTFYIFECSLVHNCLISFSNS